MPWNTILNDEWTFPIYHENNWLSTILQYNYDITIKHQLCITIWLFNIAMEKHHV